MILYHGSPYKFDILKRNQAETVDGISVPKEELQNTIYFSPNYEFALAMCSMPKGLTNVDWDNMTIQTEFPEKCDPYKKAYIYETDSEKVPKEKIEVVDEMQIAVDLDELNFDSVSETTAGEVLKYYKFLNSENREGVRSEVKLF